MKTLTAALAAIICAVPASAFELSPLFNVEVTLSPAAAAKLAESGEAITISTAYYGEAKAGADSEKGQIDLGSEEATLDAAGSVAMGGVELNEDGLGNIAGAPSMNLNVYSARKVFQDNLLSCGMWDQPVADIPATITISCALIEE